MHSYKKLINVMTRVLVDVVVIWKRMKNMLLGTVRKVYFENNMIEDHTVNNAQTSVALGIPSQCLHPVNTIATVVDVLVVKF